MSKSHLYIYKHRIKGKDENPYCKKCNQEIKKGELIYSQKANGVKYYCAICAFNLGFIHD